MEYELTPVKNLIPQKRGGKDINIMSKTTNAPEPTKTGKKYAKTRGEHFKDVVIAILIASIIAFIAGMSFQNKQQDAIQQAAKSIAPAASAEAATSK